MHSYVERLHRQISRTYDEILIAPWDCIAKVKLFVFLIVVSSVTEHCVHKVL